MADLSKLRFNGTDYNVKDASAPTRKFTNTYSKTGNLPITSDDTTQTAIGKLENNIIPKSAKGTANGVAELDTNGKVPSSQLPSYVDDVLEYSAKSSFPATGESGKIYVDTTTNKTYRWSGSAYVEISESLALGETDSTAYRGDRGKTAYNHSQLTSGNPHNVTKSDVGLGNVGNFKAVSTVASQGLSNTEKSNARANIGAGTGNGTYSKPSGGIPKSDLATAVQTSLDQVNTNKTNILYAINTGVKNIIDFSTGEITPSVTTHSVTWTIADNKGAVANGTSDSSGSYPIMTKLTLPVGTYKMSGGTSRIKFQCGNIVDSGSGATFTVNENTTQPVSFIVYATPNTTFSNETIYPMLCTEEAWNQSHDYQPPALPNYDLTRLEAEDRASLAEVVDSGAKNLLDPVNVTEGTNAAWNSTTGIATQTATDTKTWLDMRVKFYNNTTYVVTIPSEPVYVKQNGLWYIEFTKNSTFNILRVGHNGSDQDFNILINVSNLENGKNYVFSCNILQCVQASGFYSFNQLMLCTKAAFGVSKAFVPYRPDWDAIDLKTKYLAQTNTSNATSWAFPVNSDRNHFRYGLLFGGGSSQTPANASVYLVFDDASNITITKIFGNSAVTFTGAVSNSILTITSSSTIYGGVRLLWLN